jgi:hypothetical protein
VSADALADADRFRLSVLSAVALALVAQDERQIEPPAARLPASAFMFIVVPQGIRDATIAGFRAAVIV